MVQPACVDGTHDNVRVRVSLEEFGKVSGEVKAFVDMPITDVIGELSCKEAALPSVGCGVKNNLTHCRQGSPIALSD